MLTKRVGVILLAVWFLIWGALAITTIDFTFSGYVLGVLAIVGALLVLFGTGSVST